MRAMHRLRASSHARVCHTTEESNAGANQQRKINGLKPRPCTTSMGGRQNKYVQGFSGGGDTCKNGGTRE